jgi:hypothetical protein
VENLTPLGSGLTRKMRMRGNALIYSVLGC